RFIKKGDITVDATCGNGNDTLMLSLLSKKVYAFDIQKEAIEKTNDSVKKNDVKNVTLIHNSNELIDKYLNDYKGKISIVIYNLGYLPNGNKKITTNHKATLSSIKKALNMLNNKGIILVVFYPHEEGKKEKEVVLDYLNKNDIKYIKYT